MKQIVDLDLPVQLKVKLIDGGITTTDRLRVLTVKNFMHAFAISEATLARIDAELIKAGEDPLGVTRDPEQGPRLTCAGSKVDEQGVTTRVCTSCSSQRVWMPSTPASTATN
jgi:hypothetical protein